MTRRQQGALFPKAAFKNLPEADGDGLGDRCSILDLHRQDLLQRLHSEVYGPASGLVCQLESGEWVEQLMSCRGVR